MVRKHAVVTNVRIKCHRKTAVKVCPAHMCTCFRIYAGSYCRKYHYYETVTTGGPTLLITACGAGKIAEDPVSCAAIAREVCTSWSIHCQLAVMLSTPTVLCPAMHAHAQRCIRTRSCRLEQLQP